MKVGELIDVLLNHNKDATVYLEDWNEAYAPPAELPIQGVFESEGSLFLTIPVMDLEGSEINWYSGP